ncbi:hypothetical protein CEXT_669391 [Caerostris extrusa]|uniref:Uncharacterized protein n=1 Tax=Caerostris extrusa TaxID=172846 RepID=A0AAV4N870_CAEEX|nr:hypothetical protein CEXT_669391 [Caerostris extrusa]
MGILIWATKAKQLGDEWILKRSRSSKVQRILFRVFVHEGGWGAWVDTAFSGSPGRNSFGFISMGEHLPRDHVVPEHISCCERSMRGGWRSIHLSGGRGSAYLGIRRFSGRICIPSFPRMMCCTSFPRSGQSVWGACFLGRGNASPSVLPKDIVSRKFLLKSSPVESTRPASRSRSSPSDTDL